MTIHYETATIVPFPQNRFRGCFQSEKPPSSASVVPSVYDECWYHSDAMNEEKKPTAPRFEPRLVD